MSAKHLAGVVLCAAAAAARADVNVVLLGQGGPPAIVPGGSGMGGTILYAGPDPRPGGDLVAQVPIAGGALRLGVPMNHVAIGDGWPGWSHGFTGDVYATIGRPAVLITPEFATAVDYLGFYAQPEPFGTFVMAASGYDGMGGETYMEVQAMGDMGASGWGFFSAEGMHVQSVLISADVNFAIGEFGVHVMTPAPGGVLLVGAAGLMGRRRGR